MRNWISALLVMVLGMSLVGCSNMNSASTDSSKIYIGAFSGAIVGGAIGSTKRQNRAGRMDGAVIGAVLGALVGGGIGMLMRDADPLPMNHLVNEPTPQQKAQSQSKPAARTKNLSMNDKFLHLFHSLPPSLTYEGDTQVIASQGDDV